jgi:hypothetical protein
MPATLHRLLLALLVGASVALVATQVGSAAPLPVASRSLTSVRTCVVTGYPSTSTATADTYVQQGSANATAGTATSMNVSSLSGSKNQRAYVKFDLSRCAPLIATTATVQVATLRLLVSALPSGGACATEDVYRVTSTWSETTLTWNTQPTFATPRTGFTSVGGGSCTTTTTNVYANWNVTADVAAFVATTATNFGWMIRDATESASTVRTVGYYSTEINTLGASPQLVVTDTRRSSPSPGRWAASWSSSPCWPAGPCSCGPSPSAAGPAT